MSRSNHWAGHTEIGFDDEISLINLVSHQHRRHCSPVNKRQLLLKILFPSANKTPPERDSPTLGGDVQRLKERSSGYNEDTSEEKMAGSHNELPERALYRTLARRVHNDDGTVCVLVVDARHHAVTVLACNVWVLSGFNAGSDE